MARLTIPMGRGVDRQEGALTVDPAQASDARNVILHASSIRARGGLQLPTGGGPWAATTDICDIFPFVAHGVGIGVAYDRGTRVMSVWKTDLFGGTAVLLGTWATLAAGAPLPRVMAAEADNKLFLAHEEGLFNFRANTVYIDLTQAPGAQIVTLQADLDGNGSQNPVKFRGVVSYLKYLVGWGYGTDVDQNRPEIVRLSVPGQPTNFSANHYVLVGKKGDAVVACVPGTEVLVMFKTSSWFRLIGTNPANFAPRLGENGVGLVASRLAHEVNGQVFFWAESGPRVTTGVGLSTDLAEPLDLDEQEPLDLPARGPAAYGFTVHDSFERRLWFMFPEATRALAATRGYCLSLREGQGARWSYDTFQKALLGGRLLLQIPPTAGPITAYASGLGFVDNGTTGATAGYRKGTLTWTSNATAGDETAEIYFRPTGGAWSLLASQPVASTTYVKLNWDALTAGDLAIRYVRGGLATPGYEGTNPDAWNAGTAPGSKTTYVVGCTAPVLLNTITWARTGASETKHTMAWTLTEIGVGFTIESSLDQVAWGTAATIAAAGNPRSAAVVIPNPSLGSVIYYRLRATRGTETSPNSNIRSKLAGIADVPTILGLYQTNNNFGDVGLRAFVADQPALYQLYGERATQVGGPWTALAFALDGVDLPYAGGAVSVGAVCRLRVRYGKTTYGVTDYGPYSGETTHTVLAGANPVQCQGLGFGLSYTANLFTFQVKGLPPAPGETLLVAHRNDVGSVTAWTVAGAGGSQDSANLFGPGSSNSAYHLGNYPTAFDRVKGGLYRIAAGGAISALAGLWVINDDRLPILISGKGPVNPVFSQPTPGVGSIRYDWTDTPGWGTICVWREDAQPFASWGLVFSVAAGNIFGTGPVGAPLPLGVALRFRLMSLNAGQYSHAVEQVLVLG